LSAPEDAHRISGYSTNLALSRDQLEAMLKIKTDKDVTADLDMLVQCMAKGIPTVETKSEPLSRRLRGVLLDRECVRRRLLKHTGPIKRGPLRYDRGTPFRWVYLLAVGILAYYDDRLVVWNGEQVVVNIHWWFVAAVATSLLLVVVADACILISKSPEIPAVAFTLMATSLTVLLFVFSYLWPGTFFAGDDLFIAVTGALLSGAYLVSKGVVQRSALFWKNAWSRLGAIRRAYKRRRAHRAQLSSAAAQ
jgi:hypothetical protein